MVRFSWNKKLKAFCKNHGRVSAKTKKLQKKQIIVHFHYVFTDIVSKETKGESFEEPPPNLEVFSLNFDLGLITNHMDK